MPSVFTKLAALDPRARERLLRLLRRSKWVAGAGDPLEEKAEPFIRRGMTFPGDALLFGIVVAFLILCVHASLVHLVVPQLESARWVAPLVIVMAATAAVVTWKLGQLRAPPRTATEALPDPKVDSPLVELHDFAASMKRELEQTARAQRILAHWLFGTLLVVAVWGGVLFFRGYVRFAELLVASAALTTSFITLNWKPYAMARRRHLLAEQSDQVAAALAAHIHRLGHSGSADGAWTEEWSVVRDALNGALPLEPLPPVRARRRPRRRGPTAS